MSIKKRRVSTSSLKSIIEEKDPDFTECIVTSVKLKLNYNFSNFT